MKTKDTPKVEQTKEITRQCSICGDPILVTVFHDGKYSGGNYFCSPGNDDTTSKNTKLEYWECDKCYRG